MCAEALGEALWMNAWIPGLLVAGGLVLGSMLLGSSLETGSKEVRSGMREMGVSVSWGRRK